jgi:hypothetical protein
VAYKIRCGKVQKDVIDLKGMGAVNLTGEMYVAPESMFEFVALQLSVQGYGGVTAFLDPEIVGQEVVEANRHRSVGDLINIEGNIVRRGPCSCCGKLLITVDVAKIEHVGYHTRVLS